MHHRRHLTLLVLPLFFLAFSTHAQTAPAQTTLPTVRGNTTGLFQPARPAPNAQPPRAAVPATANTPAGSSPAQMATQPTPVGAVTVAPKQVKAGQPVAYSVSVPYEKCVPMLQSLKKSMPGLVEQVLADRYVAARKDAWATYQFACTRAGQMTTVITTAPVAPVVPAAVAPAAARPAPTRPAVNSIVPTAKAR